MPSVPACTRECVEQPFSGILHFIATNKAPIAIRHTPNQFSNDSFSLKNTAPKIAVSAANTAEKNARNCHEDSAFAMFLPNRPIGRAFLNRGGQTLYSFAEFHLNLDDSAIVIRWPGRANDCKSIGRIVARCSTHHADVATTLICTHVLQKGGLGVQSPLDSL